MPSVEEGLQSQVRNIESKYGRPMSAWIELIRASGRTKHSDIMAMLKTEHGMTHGSANRVALIARESIEGSAVEDPLSELYSGKRAAVRPVHDRLTAAISAFGGDIELMPKKGYLSLRRRKQFGMIQPAASRIDVGLILRDQATTPRLESAATFNAMFTHRVRVGEPDEVDGELIAWLRAAYDQAG